MPGSPESGDLPPNPSSTRALHPIAWAVSLALVGAGLAIDRSWLDLAVAAILLAFAALHAERRPLRGEAPFIVLAAVVFLAHVILAGENARAALAPSAAIALRLLALLYLIRWAARSVLGRIARWLMAMKPPRRPRFLALPWESARLLTALLPLAIRESEQHVTALKARGIRAGRGLPGIARYLLAWFLPFLGTMLRIGDAYADALITRGYEPGRPRRTGLTLGWGLREWALVLGSVASAAWLIRGA